jgi:import inner membrane translocase subunit TIM50
MLPRATLRALRIRPALAAVPRSSPSIAVSTQQRIRTYASNNRRKDNTWKRTDPIKFDEQNKARPNPVHQDQPEFDTPASPESNTTPTEPTRPKGSATEASVEAGKQFTAADQAEFAGPKTPEQNSDPTTESPESQQQQPQKPLPDLRQGIPSTFGAEFAEAEGKAKRDPDDASSFAEEPSSGSTGGREGGGGELPKSAYETSTDRRRNRVANWSYLAMLLFGTTGAVYMGRNWETDVEEQAHIDAPNGWGVGQMYARAAARINGQKAYYTEPTFQKLLPDKDKIPGGAPELTLVLSLEDLLLHSEWSTKHGYRLAKRPGLDYFLRYLSSQYELVIFTSVKSMDADPIIRKLDPFRLVMWPLFREATRFEKGEYIKVRSIWLYVLVYVLANSGRIFPTSIATSPRSSSWIQTRHMSSSSPTTLSSCPSGKANPVTRASLP